MIYKTLEAKATITELGEFSAIAAAYSVDRGGERIIPGAFEATIERWQQSGKSIPLHWDHSGKAEDIVGTVDPMSLRETDAGLEVSGKLDLDNSQVAREAWRAMKNNSLGLSFGYMVMSGQKATDGVYELKAVDLFEISITPAPMNPDTRFIDFKSVAVPPTTEELRKASGEVERELQSEKLKGIPEAEKQERPLDDPVLTAVEHIGHRLTAVEEGMRAEASAEELRKASAKVERDLQAEKIEGIPEPEPEPEEPDPVETIVSGLTDLGLRLTAIEEGMKAEATAEELRRASAKVERDLQADKIEDIPKPEPEPEEDGGDEEAPDEEPEPLTDSLTEAIANSLDERLVAIEKALKASQDVQAVEDVPDEEPEKAKSRTQDPLKQSSLATALEIISDGASLRKYQEPESALLPPEPPPEPEQWKRWIEAQL